eukprot:m.13504 g.13504  ORF g.13504 m.13504 type:complete len:263 (-) comp19988_c0_seq1:2303-3091(-)
MFGDKEVQQLCDAVASDSLHDCQQIVRSCGMLIVTADFFGSTALHNAAAHGRLLILQWFLDLHLLVNTLDSFGQTALMVAARYGRTECVRALLAAGADRRLWDEKGLTALYHAVQRNHEDIVAILAEHERSYDPVGSRTKRASREPAAPIQQAEESLEDLPIIAVFNDLSRMTSDSFRLAFLCLFESHLSAIARLRVKASQRMKPSLDSSRVGRFLAQLSTAEQQSISHCIHASSSTSNCRPWSWISGSWTSNCPTDPLFVV